MATSAVLMDEQVEAEAAREPLRVLIAGTIEEPAHQLAARLKGVAGVASYNTSESRFSWRRVDAGQYGWSSAQFRRALDREVCVAVFEQWMDAAVECDVCVLVGPRPGAEANLLAGIAHGQGKRLVVWLGPQSDVPVLMYRAASDVCLTMDEVVRAIEDEMAARGLRPAA